ncbi:tricarballylate dehydrogenase [Allgaiera indica]|uniref:Tricarballylate dehydrogenase n=2 Tax=Allgaiera indica TaxID=765699 RepID=A0A1H3B2J6_9RHOB|nr:tricarballylate dehydrogenase [Allgaiera indica]
MVPGHPRSREEAWDMTNDLTADTTCDVLIAGGGVAALCAAISAREAGASVMMVEKASIDMRGGNTRHSRNLRVAHDGATVLSPGTYGAEEYASDLSRAAGGKGDETLIRALARGSETITDWLSARGVVFEAFGRGRIPWSRKTAFLLGGGKTMLNALYAAAECRGVTIRYGATVSDLTGDGAARIVRGAAFETVTAKAVVACSGGYQANSDWLRRERGAATGGLVNRGTPFAEGEVLQSLLNLGARSTGVAGACHMVAVDARSPRHDGGIVTRVKDIPLGMVVDRAGRRFHDERADPGPHHYATWGNLIAERPDQRATLILDDAAMRARARAPTPFPAWRADTIEELAAVLQVEPGVLKHSAQEFGRLGSPPYWAQPLCPGVSFTCHGVGVDARARVILRDGRPSDHLFAAGMIMAAGVLGTGYLSGVGITIGAVFGRIAGEGAARHAHSRAPGTLR